MPSKLKQLKSSEAKVYFSTMYFHCKGMIENLKNITTFYLKMFSGTKNDHLFYMRSGFSDFEFEYSGLGSSCTQYFYWVFFITLGCAMVDWRGHFRFNLWSSGTCWFLDERLLQNSRVCCCCSFQ